MPKPHSANQFTYEGFTSPNGTIVPDDVFDVLAPRLSEAELRVLLYIVRRTFGFGKNADAISLRQLTDGIVTRDGRVLDHGTGMSRKGVIGGIKGLLSKGIITVQKAVAEGGEHEINVYSLRFREGVVTSGNYPRYRSTLPPVTQGNPQESALQDSGSQQQAPGSWPTSTGADTPVVVPADNTYGRPDLYDTLRDLGVHHHTASKLLREHDHTLIERMCEYVAQRLAQGWAPQESVAGWVVAAIRQRYELPADFRTRHEQSQEQVASVAAAAEHARLQEERAAAELQRQRAARLAVLGIEQNVDRIWQAALADLRAGGQWSLAMPLCFLKHIESGLAVVLVPARVRGRMEGSVEALEKALSRQAGQPVRVVLQDLAESAWTGLGPV